MYSKKGKQKDYDKENVDLCKLLSLLDSYY